MKLKYKFYLELQVIENGVPRGIKRFKSWKDLHFYILPFAIKELKDKIKFLEEKK